MDTATDTPIAFQLKYDVAGLIPAICQDDASGDILMLGLYEPRIHFAHARLRHGLVLQPQPPGTLEQGIDLRELPPRCQARGRL